MEGDEIRTQVNKFQKISCNGISVISDTSSNPNKIATNRHLFPVGDDGGGGGGWPASRIVRVSRASGGKDRHSKVWTSKGLRDRRIRLSVSTAIEFYDLQDRLGYDQPSKAVEWLIKAASSSVDALPSLHPSSFPLAADNKSTATGNDTDFEDLNPNLNHQLGQSNNNSNSNSNNNANACSSTSETSKGSGLSLSRSENRIRARERARDLTAKKEKEKEGVVVHQSSISSSFTDLLTGGRTEPRIHWTTTSCMDYNFQMPQFNIPTGDNNNNQQHQLSFFQENFGPVMSSGGGGLGSGLNRGTLQSNLMSSLPTHNNHHLQQLSMVDGSTSTNFPFFIGTEHFQASGYNESQRQQLYGGGDHGGGRHSDHYKEKSKN